MKIIKNSEKYIYDLEQLLQISQSLASSLNITQIIDSLVNICLTHGMVQESGIFIDDNSGVFCMKRNDSFVIKSHLNCISREKNNDFLNAVSNNESIFNYKEQDFHISLLDLMNIDYILPILYNKELLGFIVLKDPIIEDHLKNENTINFLNQIGRMSAIALKNAQLYEMATTDMMTSLKQKHFFKNHVKYSMKTNPESSFVIIGLDLDHFKRINDTYGHAAGDDVLISVAKQLIKQTRPQDMTGRMGGEEFALFLADTTIDQGKIIALRIRKEIELMKIISGEPQQELTVTASLGVTCHKKDESLETMLERCDKALYLSKNNGRNRVTVL